MGSACVFVASLISVQIANSKLLQTWRHPGFMTTMHFGCVWIGCAGYFVWKGEAGKIFPCSIGLARWMKNILPYALCMPISVVLNNVGIMEAGAGLVAIIGTLSPIVTALVSRFFGRQISIVSWFGVLVAMIGCSIVGHAEFQQAQASEQHGHLGLNGTKAETTHQADDSKIKGRVLYGMVCSLLSVFGRAIKIVISDWMLSPSAYSAGKEDEPQLTFLHIYVLQFSMGDLVTLLSALYMERADGTVEAWESLTTGVLLMIVMTCIPATILNFFGGLVLRELGAPLQQLIGKLNTLVIAAISMAFLGEHLSKETLLGTCFVLGGVAIFEYGMSLQGSHSADDVASEDEEYSSYESDSDNSEKGGPKAREASIEISKAIKTIDNGDATASDSEMDDGIHTRFPPARRLQMICAGRLCQVILLTTLWWSAAIYVTLMFKMATSSEDGEVMLPGFVLTFLVNTCTGVIAWVLTLLLPCEGTPRPSEFQTPEWLKIVVLGVVTGCEMGCLNKSLEFLSISERTFFQNANVLFTMIAAQFLGLESLTGLRLLAGFLLACGGVLQAFACKEQHEQAERLAQAAHLQGMVFMVCSMLLTSVKFTLIQLMTQRSPPTSALGRMSKLQLAALVQPITGLICVALAACFEMDALRHILDSRELLLRALWISLAITLIICTELKLVELTSAVTCGVLVNLHHIPIVLAGILLFNDPIQTSSWHGFALCLLGGCVYVYARSTDHDKQYKEPVTESSAEE